MQKFTYGGAKKTAQSNPIPEKTMVVNNAGGYVFKVDDLNQFKRFLILGTEGGSYYQNEQQLTLKNCSNLERLIKSGKGKEVIDIITDVSIRNLAPKNDAAIFSLAVVMALGDDDTKKYASERFNSVVRIGTHLLQFISYVNNLRGFGRSLRNTINNWYLEKSSKDLSFQTLKYGNRAGWTHKDVFKMTHPKGEGVYNQIFKYLVKGEKPNEFLNDETLE
jgi:60 kDa SS-A/Ro ribonucleoprotein